MDRRPANAVALALVVSDPDAANGTFYHWIVADIPPETTGFELGATPDGVVAQNSTGQSAYMGPCPPSGTHHYRFTVYALDKKTGLTEGADTTDALNAIQDVASPTERSSARSRARLRPTDARRYAVIV